MGESPGFCCGPNGRRLADVPPLPPLPPEIDALGTHRDISSRFPDVGAAEAFLAIQGRIYHCVRPSATNSTVRWLLYDGFMDNVPHSQWAAKLPPSWIDAVRNALCRVNPFVKALQQLSLLSAWVPTATLILHDAGVAEVAAIMSYDNTSSGEAAARQLVVCPISRQAQSVSTISRLWEPLSYPLLFPHGTLGWGVMGSGGEFSHELLDAEYDHPTMQMWHYRARLLREPWFEIFGRLCNEYGCNQVQIRQQDAELMGVQEVAVSDNIYLPASFLGSRRWASAQISDSLAIAAALGSPTFFITMTCNASWPEITSCLRPGQNFSDIPVVVVRVFKRKLALLETALRKMFVNVPRVVYFIHSIEFQKRGLPHAHILVKFSSACDMPCDIDEVVSAEIPSDPTDRTLVERFMMHTHPSGGRPPSKYCQ